MARLASIYNAKGEVVEIPLTKSRAIKERCLDCVGYKREEVTRCRHEKTCTLYPYRKGKLVGSGKDRNIAIKAHCSWCMGGNPRDVKHCTVKHCPLRIFRTGAERPPHLPSKRKGLNRRETDAGNI